MDAVVSKATVSLTTDITMLGHLLPDWEKMPFHVLIIISPSISDYANLRSILDNALSKRLLDVVLVTTGGSGPDMTGARVGNGTCTNSDALLTPSLASLSTRLYARRSACRSSPAGACPLWE
jgi:hypothetical protein